jgi:hypothetical protein
MPVFVSSVSVQVCATNFIVINIRVRGYQKNFTAILIS